MAYSQLTTAETDADSPLNESLFTKIKDDLDAIVDSATSKINTDMVTTASVASNAIGNAEMADNAIAQAEIANDAVGVNELKKAQEELSASLATIGNDTASLGTFSQTVLWLPQVKSSGSTETNGILGFGTFTTTYGFKLSMHVDKDGPIGSQTYYANSYYSQSSPPYILGGELWGHWLMLLRDSSGFVTHGWTAEDPYWSNIARRLGIPKDHPAAPSLLPHPWVDHVFDKKAGPGVLPAGSSIVLVDLRDFEGRGPKRPCVAELDTLRSNAKDWIARGIDRSALVLFEAAAEKAVEAEAARHAAWGRELEELTDPGRVPHPKDAKRIRRLRLDLGACSEIHGIRDKIQARGGSFLQHMVESDQFKPYREADRTLFDSVGGSAVRVVTR